MAEVKRTIKDAPTRLTEMQVQNLRNGGNVATPPGQSPQRGGQSPQQKDQFTFPSFPAPQQASAAPALGQGTGSRRSRKKGMSNQNDVKVSTTVNQGSDGE